ncbi:MAG: GNAT family N-acetyltransferase [Lachnospiraceae bacterium]|nr:GNAT family N-acetyltransferase [Lachnospiraceae bacterium]
MAYTLERRQEKSGIYERKTGISVDNKEKYEIFCQKTYVPIYSKPWWLDAVCGKDNWDVWLYEKEEEIFAAMPYYMERRGEYRYITKALLTQNNGIIFNYPEGAKNIARQKFEEKVIDAACEFIEGIKLDVYEQQYHYGFDNWLPFYWNKYEAITRYTYVLEDLKDLEAVWLNISSKYRRGIKKGMKNGVFHRGLDYKIFYQEHEKVFLKQGLECPFSFKQWERIYTACREHGAGEILYANDKEGNIASVLFLIWDEQSVYHLLGGNIPEFQRLETYDALVWEGIKFASQKGLKYDFEGSMIKRISKSFREFGGNPMPYFRIRKVFHPEIMREETEKKIRESGVAILKENVRCNSEICKDNIRC